MLDADARDGTYDIWLVDVTDWTSERLVDCVRPCLWVQEPAWSRDGRAIAYQRHIDDGGGETSQIEVLDLGSRETEVVYTTGTDRGVYAPRWSPDGGSLVFEQVVMADGDFVGVSLEVPDLADPSRAPRTIVAPDRFANNSDWSPTGGWVAFSAPIEGGEPGGDRSDLWMVRPDGTDLTQVSDVASRGGMAVQPTFTQDGERIVFLATDSASGLDQSMAVIGVDGSDLGPATTNGPTYGWHPRFRPVP